MISKNGGSLDDLPAGATVLTGSLRRRAQVLHRRNDLTVQPVRGNVQTRLAKLDESDADAMILACAGLARAELDGRITERLNPVEFLPACGQGALAIEIRDGDAGTHKLVAPMDDLATRLATTAERSFLSALGGGCQIPAGAYAQPTPDGLSLTGMVASLDGRDLLRASVAAAVDDPAETKALGQALCDNLHEQGADELLARIAEQSQSGLEGDR